MGPDLEIIVIPVRMGSSRFPAKPLTEILGVPMVLRVLRQAQEVADVSHVAVATCDSEIREVVEAAGGLCIMTSAQHERASDRTAEAVAILEREIGKTFDRVLMLQGDEPCILAGHMRRLLDKLKVREAGCSVANLLGPIGSLAEKDDPNCIKVTCDRQGRAMYFSRSAIPHGSGLSAPLTGKQVCAIGFEREALRLFSNLDQSDLERIESIDMLRFLENGEPVLMVPITDMTHAVDIPEDVVVVESLLSQRSA